MSNKRIPAGVKPAGGWSPVYALERIPMTGPGIDLEVISPSDYASYLRGNYG